VQVSPKEIEDVLFADPDGLISDVSVAGVSGGRTEDEKVPRAWIVLSDAGKKKGAPDVIKALEAWHQESLSKYKWLRGGIEVVTEVRWRRASWVATLMWYRYPKHRRGRRCAGSCRSSTRRGRRRDKPSCDVFTLL
jgi:acyl-CoA synthetase (AMP-forming)/AMP-acid ligase II